VVLVAFAMFSVNIVVTRFFVFLFQFSCFKKKPKIRFSSLFPRQRANKSLWTLSAKIGARSHPSFSKPNAGSEEKNPNRK
jgi:hypothetical protein